MERLFSANQKRHLYLSVQGRCEHCGGELDERWDAHHEKRFADGGLTEIVNAVALCKRCHILLHRRIGVISPRAWQVRALSLFKRHPEMAFLLEATPGAGKTIFSALCAQHLFEQGEIDFCLVVVPTTALKGDRDAGFRGDWHKVGLELTSILKDGRGCPNDFQGAVITYQQLPNLISTLKTWVLNGKRLFVMFDEVHHLTDNIWGGMAEQLADCIKGRGGRILNMTGTPFRGDGKEISFVKYENNKCVTDASYNYRQAVADRVCRPVQFITDDGLAQFCADEIEQREVRLSEAITEDDLSNSTKTIFRGDSAWLETVIQKADAQLDEYRLLDADAGGLVICRAGMNEHDDRHLEQIARLVKKVTNEPPEVIFYEDKDANAKIERFRKSSAKWICAVRKISEGVDIKRLRVEVIANRPTTELLFRQLIGRVVRVDDESRPGDATVYLAKFPQLSEWAARLSEEAQAGLREQKPLKERDGIDDRKMSNFVALGSTHEDGGLISDFGENYSPAEINAAERLIKNDPQLVGISLQQVLRLMRKIDFHPDPTEMPTEPLHIQKTNLSKKITQKLRELAIRRNRENPDFKGVHISLWKILGVKDINDLVENHSIEVMRQAEQIINSWLAGKHEAA